MRAGTTMIPSVSATMVDPAEWEDPMAFRPERHLDINNGVIKDTLLTFGIGIVVNSLYGSKCAI